MQRNPEPRLCSRFPSPTISGAEGFGEKTSLGGTLSAVVLGLVAMALLALPTRANVVLDWNAVMLAGIRIDTTGPTLSTRNLAILHLAIYDAINSIERTHQPYQFAPTPPSPISAEAAAAGAGYTVLTALYPTLRARSEEVFETWRAGAPRDAATTNGIEFGVWIANAVMESRAGDGSATEVPYIPSADPGQWRRTPPFFRPPLTPHWRHVTPFAIPSVAAFVPGPPPALNSPEYAESLNVVKQMGRKTGSMRTAEQSQIAVFWSDFSYTAMPPGHWQEITASIIRSRGVGLSDSARLMALLSLAQADSAIVCWEAKFRYNLWRPITAIQRADEDQNPATEPDPLWDHFLASPPFPAYTSGHSTFSKASADVLTAFFGTDAVSFTASSDSLPGVFREFTSLAACADEVGMSRIYGGIHFPFDNVEGKNSGRRIATHVVGNYLLSNTSLPFARLEGIQSGQVVLRIHGRVGSRVAVEASEDLGVWSLQGEVDAMSGGAVYSAPAGVGSRRFFRVREARMAQ